MKSYSILRQARDGEQSRAILVLLIIALLAGTAANAKYSGGTGDPNYPYKIATPKDLNDIGNHLEDFNKHFILTNDVNLAQYTGTHFNIIGNSTTNFTGVFDGNDHRVWSFTWSSTGRNYIGLFGYLSNGGQIKNLGMENMDVNAVNGNYVGGLVGDNYGGRITNCYSTGSVSGRGLVGRLVGYNYSNSTITNCYSIGSVRGLFGTGGLVGEDGYCNITNCYSTGSVLGDSWAGGLVGVTWGSSITNCCSTGSVSGNDYVGGLAGKDDEYGAIANCYSTASVKGDFYVAGLVGESLGEITNSYSTGSVSGNNYVGGLVGINEGYVERCDDPEHCWLEWHYGTITASFWDVETSDCNTSDGGAGKTTAEMKTIDTFTNAGWDFVEVWGIGEGQTYPFLRTEPAGDSNYDKKVDLIDLAILASHWLEGM